MTDQTFPSIQANDVSIDQIDLTRLSLIAEENEEEDGDVHLFDLTDPEQYLLAQFQRGTMKWHGMKAGKEAVITALLAQRAARQQQSSGWAR